MLMPTTISDELADRMACQKSVPHGMPRALHVINGRFFGGGHRSTLLLMDALERSGGAQTKLCTLGEGGDLPLQGRQPVVVSFDGRYNDPRVLWSAARQLRELVQEHDPDILHTHGVDADLIGALAVRRCRARHVSHLRITPPLGRQESWKARVRRRLLRYLTAREETWFIAVSEAVRQQMAEYYGFPVERIVTVQNGVDLSEFNGEKAPSVNRSGGPLVIGAAGRLEAMKGFEHLIAAAGKMREQGIEFVLRIAGSGSKQSDLERAANSLGIGGHVRFAGQVRNMPAFYNSVDVFVLPSVSTEGLPLVVLEAMAMGLPVVATCLAGAPEVIEDDVNGLLVPPGNPGALAQALSGLAVDRERCKRLARSGEAHVREKFTIERVAAEVTRVYQTVLA